jgi:excisionase family DNA binding protein
LVRSPEKEGGHVLEQHDEVVFPPQLWTISQVSKALNLGRTKIYELIQKENLPVQKFGRAVRVSPVELQRWLEERELQ